MYFERRFRDLRIQSCLWGDICKAYIVGNNPKRTYLKKQTVSNNGGEKSLYKCSICKVRFEKIIDHNRHSESVHELKKPSICEIGFKL